MPQSLSLKQLKELLAQSDDASQIELLNSLKNDSRAGVQKLIAQTFAQKAKKEQAIAKIQQLWQIENQLSQEGYQYICGCDEVGRGPLAGPVVAAAVIMPQNCQILGIDDSKKLNDQKRRLLAAEIKEKAIAYSISEISPRIIDAVNILQASRLAMQEAVQKLAVKADFIVVDGWDNPLFTLPQKSVIKGDSKCFSIACASIIAKVYRDELMESLACKYPGYGFDRHKGYPTKEHYQALKDLGPTDIHRISFDLKL